MPCNRSPIIHRLYLTLGGLEDGPALTGSETHRGIHWQRGVPGAGHKLQDGSVLAQPRGASPARSITVKLFG